MSQIVQPGQLVAERFAIVRLIAEGGMGEVYEAEDRVLGEHVALKFLNRRNMHLPDVERRFRREVQLARRVTHPNVCRLFDVFHHTLGKRRRVTFVTMELLRGETLSERLIRGGKMSEDEALPLVAQMAAALTAAHDAGVIHRDFKTSNVMLEPALGDEPPRVVVTDFGLARQQVGADDTAVTPLTGEQKIVGTADYMSPEQIRGEAVGTATDLYAFGVVIYQMVTAGKPFVASNPIALFVQRLNEPPRPPRALAPDLDPAWEETILRLLAKQAEDRPASAREVVAALSGDSGWHERGGSSSVITRPIADVLEPPKRRRGWLIAATALTAAAAVVVLGVLRWQQRPPVPALPTFSPAQLTTAGGLELDPAFSPDGAQVVYSSDRSGAFELYVRDLAPGGVERQLTDYGGQLFEPDWSPDGSTVVYHSQRDGGIWAVGVAGGRPRRLSDFGSRPRWSPDGMSIAFQSESAPQVSATTAPAIANSTLWWVDAEGGAPRPLTRAGEPSGGHAAPRWSPDGSRLVFSASQRGASEIWSIGSDGKDLVAVTDELASAVDPAFAAAGDAVYFSASDRQVNALWRVPVSPSSGRPQGEPQQIANLGASSIRQAAISPNGRQMVFTAMSTVSNLWSLPLDEAGGAAGLPRALTSGTGRNNRPAFSADGASLAFDRWRPGVDIDVYTMSSAGDDVRQITLDPWSNSLATWLPDGRLAFVAEDAGRRWIAAVDAGEGGGGVEQTPLVDLADDADWARLSPDGAHLAYHSRGDGLSVNLWLLELATRERRQLTAAEELMGFPCWSPDGAWIAFQSRTGEDSQVMVLPATGSSAGGTPVQLTDQPGESWAYSFSPDSARVAFAGRRGGFWNIYWVSRTSREQHRLTDYQRLNAYVRFPAWSPAGDRIVYELAETTGDLWLVDLGS